MTDSAATPHDVGGGYLLQILNLHERLSTEILAFGDDRIEKISPVYFRLPPNDSAAMRFYGTVSWAYIALWEKGPITFRFLIERAKGIGIDPHFEMPRTYAIVRALRTLFQHELNPSVRHDSDTLTLCSRWMANACGSDERVGDYFWPDRADDWENLNERFVSEIEVFLERCIDIAQRIRRDEFHQATVSALALRCSRSLEGHVFDKMIGEAIPRLGLPAFDGVRVRTMHLQKWNERLRLLDETSDLQNEAKKLVEETLLRESEDFCPLNGDDIIQALAIQPGPIVGKLVVRARAIWKSAPCSREELLLRLKAEVVS